MSGELTEREWKREIENDRLTRALATAGSVLRQVEWAPREGIAPISCVCCGRDIVADHIPDCALAAALLDPGAGADDPTIRKSRMVAAPATRAREEVRRATIEECAAVAASDTGKAPGGNPDFGPNVACRIETRIRALAQEPSHADR